MTIKEVTLLKPGTSIYKVTAGKISEYWYIGRHPKSENSVILGSALSVDVVKVFHPRIYRDSVWETDYEVAKEKMWLASVEELNTINDAYFDGSKDLKTLEIK